MTSASPAAIVARCVSAYGRSVQPQSEHRNVMISKYKVSQATPTYRNPLRVIAHCDIDAAYAQFEAVRIGSPDDVPLIVIQWETIIAVNYPARKYGIKRCSAMGPKEARELCPHVVIVHTATYRPGESESGYWDDANVLTHKVSLDPYRRESTKILSIFQEMVPSGVVEKASIDEAYLDLTEMVLSRLRELHPYLNEVPADAPDELDTPLPEAPHIKWEGVGNVVPIGDEAVARDTWSDWALFIGAQIMAEVRAEIWTRLHYTCSAGIAHNKAMAKLCSSFKKPNNQTVLRFAAVPNFLRDRDFRDIRNLGGKLGRSLAEEYSAETVDALLHVSLDDMQQRFGEESIWIYNIIRGIDETPLTARHVNKTMLASKNIIPAITSPEQAPPWIDLLAGELNVRLREAREIDPGLWPRTLVLSQRTGFGYGNNLRSKRMPFPFTNHLDADFIAKMGKQMWKQMVPVLVRAPGGMDVHSLALQFANVERAEDGQVTIEGFLGVKHPLSPARVSPDTGTTWTCSKCRTRIPVPDDVDEEIVKAEHADYHLALQLSREYDRQPSTPKKARARTKSGGIMAFFKPSPK